MKCFFILKDEFINHEVYNVDFNNQLILIKDKETLLINIQDNNIKKYRKINPFRNGSIVKLRKDAGLIWNALMTDRYCGKEVMLRESGVFNQNYIAFKDDDNWSFYADSIEEVIKY